MSIHDLCITYRIPKRKLEDAAAEADLSPEEFVAHSTRFVLDAVNTQEIIRLEDDA